MSAHNPMTLCQNLSEIGPVVFEIWPIKDGPLEAEKRSTAPLWLFVATAVAAVSYIKDRDRGFGSRCWLNRWVTSGCPPPGPRVADRVGVSRFLGCSVYPRKKKKTEKTKKSFRS